MPNPTRIERPCRRLRSKGMYIEVEPDLEVTHSSDGFYWCSHTQNCLGPDNKPVDSDHCKAGRHCYEV